MDIVQISDTHFGTEVCEVEDALVEHLRASPPDIVLLTGDVTQRARRDQFARAQRFLEKLPVHRFIAVPGNHDIPLYHLWRRLFKPYGGFLGAFNETEGVYVSDDCTIIGVNSTNPYKHKDGILTPKVIDQVATQLEANRHSHLRIVAAHHPVAVVLASDKENLVENAEAAVRVWSQAGMDLMLGGHIHYPFMAPLRGHYPHIETDAWVMQAGTAVSRRVRSRKPNSFNKIFVQESRANSRIEQWNFDDKQADFVRVESFTPWRD